MDIKELNSNSYNVNSKYKKHTGIGIKKSQKVGRTMKIN